MADASDDEILSDTENGSKKRRRVYDVKKKSAEVLKRYYASDERQKKLVERIKLYEDNIQHLSQKIAHLRQFVIAPENERT